MQRNNFGIPPQYNDAKVDRDLSPSFSLFGQQNGRRSRRNDGFGRLF